MFGRLIFVNEQAQTGSASGSEREPAAEAALAVKHAVISDEQAKLLWEGERCAACGGRKRAAQAFCATDFVALTLWVRRWLMQGPSSATYAQTFRSALRHLELNPVRKTSLPSQYGEWKFRSDADLERGGFKFIKHGECAVPRCGARVMWYWTPNGRKVAVNLRDYQIHRPKCVDPEYFERREAERKARRDEERRKKRLQTTARRKAAR